MRSTARRWRWLLILVAIVGAGFAASSLRAMEWLFVRTTLRIRFPEMQWLRTAELADWQTDPRRQPPVLFDVRTGDEWNVSHIPGATRLGPDANVVAEMGNVPRDAAIVTYCSVGYRSGEMARRLRGAGFTHVQNLEGSIFAWANEHRPLVNAVGPTNRVHPFNTVWGRLLAPDVRAPR